MAGVTGGIGEVSNSVILAAVQNIVTAINTQNQEFEIRISAVLLNDISIGRLGQRVQRRWCEV